MNKRRNECDWWGLIDALVLVGYGSYLAARAVTGEGPQSEVKLKQTARKPTFGFAHPVLRAQQTIW